jgi:hypothetical protein
MAFAGAGVDGGRAIPNCILKKKAEYITVSRKKPG